MRVCTRHAHSVAIKFIAHIFSIRFQIIGAGACFIRININYKTIASEIKLYFYACAFHLSLRVRDRVIFVMYCIVAKQLEQMANWLFKNVYESMVIVGLSTHT